MRVKDFPRFAAQAAVLGVFGPSNAWLPAAETVLRKWQRRVAELHNIGWRPASHKKPNNVLQQCRPFVPGLTGVFGSYCDIATLCPWCWGRFVSTVAPRLRRGIKYLAERKQCEPIQVTSASAPIVPGFPVHMLERDHRIDLQITDPTALANELHRMIKLRSIHLSDFKVAGALSVYSLSPLQGGWRVHSRQIMMVAAPFVVKELTLPKEGTIFLRYTQPSMHQLIDAIGRTMQYPRYLLDGPLDSVVEYLETRQARRLRMVVTSGEFFQKPRRRICGLPSQPSSRISRSSQAARSTRTLENS